MNEFELIAENYKKLVAKGKLSKEVADAEIKIFDFLSSCNDDDICRLVDSSVFNTVIKAYCQKAMEQANVKKATIQNVLMELSATFDMYTAKEIIQNYEKSID